VRASLSLLALLQATILATILPTFLIKNNLLIGFTELQNFFTKLKHALKSEVTNSQSCIKNKKKLKILLILVPLITVFA